MKSREDNGLTVKIELNKNILEQLEDPSFWLPSPKTLTMENKTNIIYFLFRVKDVLLGYLDSDASNDAQWQSWCHFEKASDRAQLMTVMLEFQQFLGKDQKKAELIAVLLMIKKKVTGLSPEEKAALVQTCLTRLTHDSTLLFLYQLMGHHNTWLMMANVRYEYFLLNQGLDEKRKLAALGKRKESDTSILSKSMANSHQSVFIMLGGQKFAATDQEYASAVRIWHLKQQNGLLTTNKMALTDLVGFIQRKRLKAESKALSAQSQLNDTASDVEQSTTVSLQEGALLQHMVKSIQAEGVVCSTLLRIKKS